MGSEPRDQFEDHWLYRIFDASGALLYVGITTTGVKRFRIHGNRAAWWPQVDTIKVEHHPSEDAVRAAEIATIRRERPKFNRDFNAAATNLEVMYCQCRFCREHYRPEPGYKLKRCCPPCKAAGRTLEAAAARRRSA